MFVITMIVLFNWSRNWIYEKLLQINTDDDIYTDDDP